MGNNETYETRHKKYPINLPNEIYAKARLKAKEKGFLELAPYLRAIIIKEVNEGQMRIEDVIGTKETRRLVYEDNQRRENQMRPGGFSVPARVKNLLDKFSGKN